MRLSPIDNLRTMPAPVADTTERRLALDVTRSWIVEAPAGSGKTGLLLQRYLALLASETVLACDEVLAITFTRAATEEIRSRLLDELRAAAAGAPVRGEYEATTRALARTVLERDRRLSWGLLEDARRLRVLTIDALCAEIARSLPVLQRGARALSPVEDAEPLYREAARRTLLRLGRDETGVDRRLGQALRTILLHRDGDLSACQELLAEMLASREQWGKLLPLRLEAQSDEDLDLEVRPKLDAALETVVCDGLSRLMRAFPPGSAEVLSSIAADLAQSAPHGPTGAHPFSLCRDLIGPPAAKAEFLEHWKEMLHAVLTKGGKGWRKGVASHHLGVVMEPHQARALKDLVGSLAERPELLEEMKLCLLLPPSRYPDDQWAVAKPLLRVLRQAAAELQEVFLERGVCDFVEPALLARAALEQIRVEESGDEDEEPTALPGSPLRHLLVDEVQDTSSQQYELLERLTAGWNGATRTVFLVGDPKQSIYLFRQARVERFVQAMRTKRLGELPLGLIRLTANFRSRRGLVQAANETFAEIFPAHAVEEGQVTYNAVTAARGVGEPVAEEGYAWHVTETIGEGREGSGATAAQARRDAKRVRRWLNGWVTRPLPKGRTAPWTAAVLVQNRKSLEPILKELQNGEPLPYRAVQIDFLTERREILDLLALTRALLHPGDRIAWLAVLHAPWCGLGVADLHTLTGADAPEMAGRDVLDLIAERGSELGAESLARLERVWPILRRAADMAGELRMPELVERTWRSLGGNAYLKAGEAENAATFLALLRTIDRETGVVGLEDVERRLKRLFAAPTTEPTMLDVTTIHGSKGLEWDVVIVPELERAAPAKRGRLLEWEELADGRGVILAPIAGKGEDSAALHKWLARLSATRDKAERKRLLYVACTRAREELYLVGSVVHGNTETKPRAGSLLEVAWPAVPPDVVVPEETTIAGENDEATGGDGIVLSLAAAAEPETNGKQMSLLFGAPLDPVVERPAMLERVPADFNPLSALRRHGLLRDVGERAPVVAEPARRVEGSFAARAFGNVVHAVLELAAGRFARGLTKEQVRREAEGWRSRYGTLLRAEGLAPAEVEPFAERVRLALDRTLRDEVGLWILQARAEARAEVPLTTWGSERRAHRMDRMFLGGPTPGVPGASHRWIVDYKTAVHGREGLETFLDREEERYRGQMDRYAAAIPDGAVCVGLWFPMLGRLRWWTRPDLTDERATGRAFGTALEDDVASGRR